VRPFPVHTGDARDLTAQQRHDDVLDINDVLGRRLVETRLQGKVTIREENASAALEVMSRFAADPKWLIYLPPTMSPSETSKQPELLEHPEETFAYYRTEGTTHVICEEKHMGSRAVVIVCKHEDAARARFGVLGQGSGIVYTRTGRRFFEDRGLEDTLLARLQRALDASGLWDELETDWALLDCELMPWSAKAQDLLPQQYAAVGAAARIALPAASRSLQAAAERGLETAPLLERYRERAAMAARYVDAYRRYCWPVSSLDDLKLARAGPARRRATNAAPPVGRRCRGGPHRSRVPRAHTRASRPRSGRSRRRTDQSALP
jgi:protein phosphatase